MGYFTLNETNTQATLSQFQFPGTLMVRERTVNASYTGNGYAGSSPAWGAINSNCTWCTGATNDETTLAALHAWK